MRRRPMKTPPEAVSELQRQITEWREQRPKPGCRIPEKFWTEATRLGRDFGVSLVSRHLKMDYHGLKRRVFGLPKTQRSSKVDFVEVRMGTDTPSGLSADSGVVTEIEIHKDGATAMRVRQSGPTGNDLSAIVASFMRGSC